MLIEFFLRSIIPPLLSLSLPLEFLAPSLQQSNADHTLFLKYLLGKVTTLVIYVDDMIITGDDEEEISMLQGQLAVEFEMKN